MGIKKEIIEKGSRIEIEREGMMMRRVKMGSQKWRMI